MPILPQHLPEEVSYETKDGFYARKNDDHEIVHFGFYSQGEPTGWVLDLAADSLRATRIEKVQIPDPFEESELSQEDLEYWVEKVVSERGEKPVTCSFCEKTQAEVLKIIAGPTCYICNECIELCHEVLQSEV